MGGDRIYYKNKSNWIRKKTEKNKNKYKIRDYDENNPKLRIFIASPTL